MDYDVGGYVSVYGKSMIRFLGRQGRMVSLYPMLQLYSRMVPCSAPLGVTTPCTQSYLVVCAVCST